MAGVGPVVPDRHAHVEEPARTCVHHAPQVGPSRSPSSPPLYSMFTLWYSYSPLEYTRRARSSSSSASVSPLPEMYLPPADSSLDQTDEALAQQLRDALTATRRVKRSRENG